MQLLIPAELEIARQEALLKDSDPKDTTRLGLALPKSELTALQNLADRRGLSMKGLIQGYIADGTMVNASMSKRGSVLFVGLNNQGTIEQERAIFI